MFGTFSRHMKEDLVSGWFTRASQGHGVPPYGKVWTHTKLFISFEDSNIGIGLGKSMGAQKSPMSLGVLWKSPPTWVTDQTLKRPAQDTMNHPAEPGNSMEKNTGCVGLPWKRELLENTYTPEIKCTILIGNTFSNHWFSGDMLVVQGVHPWSLTCFSWKSGAGKRETIIFRLRKRESFGYPYIHTEFSGLCNLSIVPSYTRWWFQIYLPNIFQMGWNHQPVNVFQTTLTFWRGQLCHASDFWCDPQWHRLFRSASVWRRWHGPMTTGVVCLGRVGYRGGSGLCGNLQHFDM